MTDKQIIMKEITECGFYCSKDDTERLYIYEVIKNTDEKWLKENPEATLLIDEWIYDYTDYDDRKVYNTGGNLTVVCNDSAKCKVYKIEDTKYKIYGNYGQFLIEDKPTYKEQLKQAEQTVEECHKYMAELEDKLTAKEQECEELKDKLNCCFCSPYVELNDIEKQRKCVEVTECFRQQLDQLKAEKEELKKIIERLDVPKHEVIDMDIALENEKLKATLAEIKPILEFYANSKMGEEQPDGTYKTMLNSGYVMAYDPRPARQALQKISECEVTNER